MKNKMQRLFRNAKYHAGVATMEDILQLQADESQPARSFTFRLLIAPSDKAKQKGQ